MASTKKYIWINTDYIGFHYWKDAPDDLGYLANIHRHRFVVHVVARVDQPDREIEFHTLKKVVDSAIDDLKYRNTYTTPIELSCEMMAEGIGNWLISMGYPIQSVTVSEDGECGGGVRYGQEPI